MQNTGIKHIMNIDMFCWTHEGGDLVNGNNGAVKYSGGQTICIEIDKHMSHNKFKSRVCGIFNLQLDLVKHEFTVKFDTSLLILLCDNASFVSMLIRNNVYCRVYVSSTGHVASNYPNLLM